MAAYSSCCIRSLNLPFFLLGHGIHGMVQVGWDRGRFWAHYLTFCCCCAGVAFYLLCIFSCLHCIIFRMPPSTAWHFHSYHCAVCLVVAFIFCFSGHVFLGRHLDMTLFTQCKHMYHLFPITVCPLFSVHSSLPHTTIYTTYLPTTDSYILLLPPMPVACLPPTIYSLSSATCLPSPT